MILETKLTLPQPKAGALLRTGLIDLIKNNLDKKLILITAGAGYGKTTLLGQLANEASLPSVFYDLDKSDSDLMVFYSYLVNGIKRIDPNLVNFTEDLLRQGSEAGKNIGQLFGALINELCEKRKEELFILLDNYHNIAEDSLVHNGLDFFIDHLPGNIRVILSSRSIPPLFSLAKWQAKQDTFEATRGDLCFTANEVRELLEKTRGRTSDEEDLNAILNHTAGWITGIQLILQGTGRGGKQKTVRETIESQMEDTQLLFHYFMNEILLSEPEPVREFLIRSSFLDPVTPDACDCIMETNGSEKMLQGLEKSNLFIARIGRNEYQYHALFKAFLQSQLLRGGETAALHQKAASYFLKCGKAAPAIDHYLDAGHFESAVRVIVDISQEMLDKGRIMTLSKWLDKVPGRIFEASAELHLIKASICLDNGGLKEAYDLYDRVEEIARHGWEMSNKEKQYLISLSLLGRARLLYRQADIGRAKMLLQKALRICPVSCDDARCNILNTKALVWQSLGDYGRAKACLQKARTIAVRLANPCILARVECNIAWQCQQLGDLKPALAFYKALFDKISQNQYWPGSNYFLNAASAALCAGESAWAEKCLETGRRLADTVCDLNRHAKFDNIYGVLCTYLGQLDRALSYLEKAGQEFAAMNIQDGMFAVHCNRARVFRYLGDRDKAEVCLNQAVSACPAHEDRLNLLLLVEKALFNAFRGRLNDAESDIKAGLAAAGRRGAQAEMFLLDIAVAAVRLKQGRESLALRDLAKAVVSSRRNGYDGILSLELGHNPCLAKLALKLPRHGRYLETFKPGMMPGTTVASESLDFDVKMFGALEFFRDGRALSLHWHSRKGASLLAYLLVHKGRACGREELIAEFWPAIDRHLAGEDLRSTISMLNKTVVTGLEQAGFNKRKNHRIIVHQPDGYRINPAMSFHIDVELFDEMRHRAQALGFDKSEERTALLRQCRELYRDDFLANLRDNWCLERRNACEISYLKCLQSLANHHLEKQEYEEVVSLCLKHLDKNPYSEEMHITLWKALKATGRKDEILYDYKRLKILMKRELKAKPSENCEKKHRELMD